MKTGEPANIRIAPPALAFVVLDAAALGGAGQRRDADTSSGAPGVFTLDADEGEGLAECGAEA